MLLTSSACMCRGLNCRCRSGGLHFNGHLACDAQEAADPYIRLAHGRTSGRKFARASPTMTRHATAGVDPNQAANGIPGAQ
jgi:hypothetical protein